DAAELDIRRHRAAAQLAAPLTLFPPRGEAVPIGTREAMGHQLLNLAAVVIVVRRRVIAQCLGLDHVTTAQLDAVDARYLRGTLDQALDQIDRLRPAGAAINRGRRGVGEHSIGAHWIVCTS